MRISDWSSDVCSSDLLDVARPDEVAAVADRIYRDHGAVHLLCNNAGVARGGHLSAMTHDDWRWMISVNIEGVTNGLTAFLPRMIAQAGEAHIVNPGSIPGRRALPEPGRQPPTPYQLAATPPTRNNERAPHHT